MNTLRRFSFISLILTALLLTTALGLHLGESSSAESSEEAKKTQDSSTVHTHVKGPSKDTSKAKDKDTGGSDNVVTTDADPQQNCALRHKICRTFGPKPLPCCEGYVCRTTYGEQHCVDPDTKIQ